MEFAEHLHRLRSGDTSAIREFVNVYEPFIRRSLRFRIQNSALQSAADSIDLCQSVLGTFLLRLSAGEFVLHTEEDLRNLLFSIANKKFLMLKRRESAEKRNRSLTCSLSDVPEVVNGKEVPPSFQLERGELMQQVVSRLDSEEHQLFTLRCQQWSWKQIEASLGVDSSVLRQRLSRAIRRVSVELGLEDCEPD